MENISYTVSKVLECVCVAALHCAAGLVRMTNECEYPRSGLGVIVHQSEDADAFYIERSACQQSAMSAYHCCLSISKTADCVPAQDFDAFS